MHRLLIPLISLLAFGGLVAIAAPAGDCTKTGTKDRDILTGNHDAEKICGLEGGDYIHSNGGRDLLLGGGGRDTMVGGAGPDRVNGGTGSDRLFSIDQNRGNDIIRGGRGDDACYADRGDIVRSCETVSRGNGDRTTQAVLASFRSVAEVGEEALEDQVPACPDPADLPPAC